MAKEFSGTISLDIRDSVPDWGPYAEPKAKPGAPNILYLVIDDTGFGAWDTFGGKIKMPNLSRIAEKGLVYTNFHTTALCSPTRSSLLNGRNATSNGMSCIEEATSGFPGSNGRIPFENAFLPAVLSEQGYSTFAIGKWHLLPEEEAHMAASKRNWPLGRGFERYYGFLGGETDQWYPDIVYDNHIAEPPYEPDMDDPENGYHLSKDLVDKAISFIQDTTAIAPDKPWMMYFSPGANHAPHHIWPQKIVDYGYNTSLTYIPDDDTATSFEYTSVFTDGYEVYREETLAAMKDLGIFGDEVDSPAAINPHNENVIDPNYPYEHTPAEVETPLTEDDIIGVPPDAQWPQTDYVRPWASLEQKEKALFVRMAEVYAAFSTYTDEQIGRLLDFLEEIGQMENTIIVAVADNGASAEGGPNGSVNENLFFNDVPDDIENNLALLDKLGTMETYNHYPSGWAWAFDTPFKYWKRWSGYEGGAATPFVLCGPGISSAVSDSNHAETLPAIDGSSRIRKQYIHAVDVVPTLYDMVDIEPPAVVKGYTQNSIEGISFKYTFDDKYGTPQYQFAYNSEAQPTTDEGQPVKVRESQFYSMLGTRGMWSKGWHACTIHAPTPSDWGHFDQDTWELYCMDGDELVIDENNKHTLAADPSQSINLVDESYAASPDVKAALNKKLESLKSMWFAQAGIYNGMPLDDRSTAEILGAQRPQLTPTPFEDGKDTFSYTYYPGGSEIPESVAPNARTRSYDIAARVDNPANTTGVLFAHGGRFGGHSLYMNEGKLCYVYNWLGQREQKVSGDLPEIAIPNDGGIELKVSFAKTGTAGSEDGWGGSVYGDVTLTAQAVDANGDLVDSAAALQTQKQAATPDEDNWADWPADSDTDSRWYTQPAKFALSGEGMNIGRDGGQPVSRDYESPGELEGATIKKVVVTIHNDAEDIDPEKEFKGMLWRD